jgi:hypothetical protein
MESLLKSSTEPDFPIHNTATNLFCNLNTIRPEKKYLNGLDYVGNQDFKNNLHPSDNRESFQAPKGYFISDWAWLFTAQHW